MKTLLLLITFTVFTLDASPAAAAKPNVLLIVSDDQGYPDLGCIGTKPIKYTFVNGFSLRYSYPAMIILATQKNKISGAVTRSLVG